MSELNSERSIQAELSVSSVRIETDDYWYKVMSICNQASPTHFGMEFPSWSYLNFEYLDSGTYSHVIKAIALEYDNTPIVFKIIKVIQKPTLNHLKMLSFNGFELYMDVYQEIMIVKVLSDLHQTICDSKGYEYLSHSYPKIYCCRIVHGEIPNYFLVRKYDEGNPKAKEVERFEELLGVPREHLAIVMKFCGDSLWHLVHKATSHNTYGISPEQLLSVCYQVTLALAVAEGVYEFEHRDLHVCNVLVKKTKKEYIIFVVQSVTYRVKSFGVKACIIDATFSRICLGSEVFYTDLSNRLKATAAIPSPDSQEVAYQQMYKLIFDKWRDWYPETNVIWLKYFYNEVYNTDAFNANCEPVIKRNLVGLIEAVSNYQSLVEFVHKMFQYGTDSGTSKRPKRNQHAGRTKSNNKNERNKKQ